MQPAERRGASGCLRPPFEGAPSLVLVSPGGGRRRSGGPRRLGERKQQTVTTR